MYSIRYSYCPTLSQVTASIQYGAPQISHARRVSIHSADLAALSKAVTLNG